MSLKHISTYFQTSGDFLPLSPSFHIWNALLFSYLKPIQSRPGSSKGFSETPLVHTAVSLPHLLKTSFSLLVLKYTLGKIIYFQRWRTFSVNGNSLCLWKTEEEETRFKTGEVLRWTWKITSYWVIKKIKTGNKYYMYCLSWGGGKHTNCPEKLRHSFVLKNKQTNKQFLPDLCNYVIL